jgi:hypothetical protein
MSAETALTRERDREDLLAVLAFVGAIAIGTILAFEHLFDFFDFDLPEAPFVLHHIVNPIIII